MTSPALPALRECPFCGGAADIEQYGDRSRCTIYACSVCGCRLETGEEWGHGGQWNTRAAPAWQDIASAQGLSEIIGWCDAFGGSRHHFKWCDDKYTATPRPYWECRAWGVSWSRQNQPTLFQPLPAPPGAP